MRIVGTSHDTAYIIITFHIGTVLAVLDDRITAIHTHRHATTHNAASNEKPFGIQKPYLAHTILDINRIRGIVRRIIAAHNAADIVIRIVLMADGTILHSAIDDAGIVGLSHNDTDIAAHLNGGIRNAKVLDDGSTGMAKQACIHMVFTNNHPFDGMSVAVKDTREINRQVL